MNQSYWSYAIVTPAFSRKYGLAIDRIWFGVVFHQQLDEVQVAIVYGVIKSVVLFLGRGSLRLKQDFN
ncbi:MAG TPA: hypothetical protein VN801_08275 [Candidatus Udaeobacter sp.]|jgi:hypothetical protein|nr:hypothetical protein [Candidatus Udaeobacter sp.]